MRILFAGSPEIALPSLEALGREHELVGVLTNPPAPAGRGMALRPSPTAARAAELFPGLPILEPERLGPAERAAVAALRPEALVVYAYGRIFGPKFLALFPRGGINAHPSLLPRWRGCAPIPYAIMHRDAETGISVQRIAREMDAGDILAMARVPLRGDETTASLSAWAAEEGARLLSSVLADMEAGRERGVPQDPAAASYCAAIRKDDGLVDWSMPAVDIHARLRAFTPWPGLWTSLGGRRLAVLEAGLAPAGGRAGASAGGGAAGPAAPPGAVLRVDKSEGIMVQTGEGELALLRLQLEGKKALPFKDFANGNRGLEGSVLGAGPAAERLR